MPVPHFAEFSAEVYNVVSQIPKGRVLTYGAIARLIGWPQHSRLVGRALRCVPEEQIELPCHRVVNSSGRTAPGWKEQPEMLQEEGVRLKPNGAVDLNYHLWHPAAES